MSAMKPDGYAVQMNTGNFVGIWREKAIAESVCSKQPASHNDTVEPLYTLATVRKWLEEETSEAVRDAFYLACDVEFQSGSLADGFRAMLAAKLREMENDT